MKIDPEREKYRVRKRLVVFSGVAHHNGNAGSLAHRGFVREIDIWARIFDQVLVITRCGSGLVLSDDIPYAEGNISVVCLPAPANTNAILGKIKLAFYFPVWVWISYKYLSPRDIIMARGPDSIGFLGWMVSRFIKLPRFAKYADQWENFPGEPPGYRLQKYFYRSKNFGGPVMIYGKTDSRHPHLIPFFTSGITELEWKQAGLFLKQRTKPPVFHLLFVGRFVFFKGIDILLMALKHLNGVRTDLVLHLVGDGPENVKIMEIIKKENLSNVQLHGWLGPDELSMQYAQAHILIHPSRKEGFGKVLLEAMSYSLPIIGADVGVSRELVEKNQCGILFAHGDDADLARKIIDLLTDNKKREIFGEKGRQVSKALLLENLEQRYREFFKEQFSFQ